MKPKTEYGQWKDVKINPPRGNLYLGCGKHVRYGVEDEEFSYVFMDYFADEDQFHAWDYSELEFNVYYWAELPPLPEPEFEEE